MQILLTTTGSEINVVINDLGAILFQHPQIDIPLLQPEGSFTIDVINESLEDGDLGAAVTAGEITLTDDTGNPITPGSNLLDFVDRTSDQTVGGLKTFTEDIITIDSPNSSTNLEMGYFPSVVPSCYGVRTTGTGFYYCMGANAINPQIVLGSPSAGGIAYFDTDAARPLFLNVLNTGTGLGIDGRGEVVIGRAGLEIGSLNAEDAPNLRLTSITGSNAWNIYTGSPANFDGWLRFSSVGSANQNELALLPNGSLRGSNGSAGSPGFSFLNASNYGMFLSGTNDTLGLVTGGFTRLQISSTGVLSTGNTPNYETLIGADDDIPNIKWINDNVGGTGGGGTGFIEYKFDNSTSMSNPGNGEFRYNNSNPALVTAIAISDESEAGGDISSILSFVQSGNVIYIQEIEDGGAFAIFEVTSTVDNGTWWQINVTVSDSGTLPDNGKECGVNFIFGGGAEVNDLTAAVTWDIVPDAFISQTSVTQHEAAIDHDALLNFEANEHIDWTVDQGVTNINNANIELAFVDLTDVDNVTIPFTAGDLITFDGINFKPADDGVNNQIGLLQNGCVAEFIDSTGLDFCNTQIGATAGSAFYIAKRALGTLATPLPVTDGIKIGGYSFLAFDGVTSNPGYVGAEINSFAQGDQDGANGGANLRFLVTPQGTKTPLLSFIIQDDGILTVGDQTDYETQIIGNDDAIPNVKYVNDRLTLGDLATVSVRRQTELNPIPLAWTDFDWTIKDEENDTTVIEYTGTPADEIEIKEAGLYWIAWAITADDEIDVRLTNNGTVLPGSFHSVGDKADAIQDFNGNSKGRSYTLAAGTLVLQVQATTGAEFTIADSATLSVVRLSGAKGDVGAQGPAGDNTVIVQEGGIGSAPINTLNFDETDFDISISGSPGNFVANIEANIPPAPLAYGAIRVESTGADQATNYNVTTPEIALVLTGTESNFGAGATYFTNNSGSITCDFDGVVEVTYSVPHFGTATTRLSLKSVIQLNGVNYGAVDYGYIRDGSGHQRDTNNGADTIAVSNGDVIRIGMRRAENSTSGGAITIEPLTAINIKRVA